MANQQDRGQWPRGLAGYDRAFAANNRGGTGVNPNKVREALAPRVRDDELVDSRHTARRLYLGDDDVTIHYLELVLTDRQLLAIFEVKRGFRKQVDVLSFEYLQLFSSMECKDTPLTPQDGSIMIWMAFLRFIDGRNGHVLNFFNADQRDAFAQSFERLAGARGMQFDPRGPERAFEEVSIPGTP